MAERIVWIDNLKGIAILLVVVRHVMQANITDCSQTIIGNAIFAVQMPLFMTIAGYFSVTSDKYYENEVEIRNYIKNRGIHYVLPFFSWYIFVIVLLRGFCNRNIIDGLRVLVYNIDYGLWFLYVLFCLSVVNIMAQFICSKLKKISNIGNLPMIVGWGILLPLSAFGYIYGMRFLGINLLLYYYLFFSLGYFLFCNKEIVKKLFKSDKTLWSVCIITWTMFIGIICAHNIELASDSVINIVLRIAAAVSGCTAISIIVFVLSKNRKSRLLSKVGQNTLEIYVVHVQYIGLLPKGTYYLYSVDGIAVFLLAMGLTTALTVMTIVAIKNTPVMNVALFGKGKNL